MKELIKEAVQNYKEIGHTALSYSALKELRAGGIYQFYRYKERELEGKYSDSLTLGTLIDEYFLNQEKFSSKYIIEEGEAPSNATQLAFCHSMGSGLSAEDAFRANYSTKNKSDKKIIEESQKKYKEFKEYIDFLPKAVGKETYTNEQSYALNQIRMNIAGHKVAKKLFPWVTMSETPDHIEIRTHVKLDSEYKGFPIKGEIDLIYIDHKKKEVIVYDLKSTKSHIKNFKYEARNYSYFLQLFLYGILVKNEILPELTEGEDLYTMKTPRFIVVRNQGCYSVGICQPDINQIKKEQRELLLDIETLSWHYSNKRFKYPKGYYEGDGIETLDYMEDVESWREDINQRLSQE